jgi:hypothetical protein
MAFETEIGAAIGKIVEFPPEVATATVCERRSYLAIDTDMAQFSFLFNPAIAAVLDENYLPVSYVNLFQTHIFSNYPRYRVCGTAALLCVLAATVVS